MKEQFFLNCIHEPENVEIKLAPGMVSELYLSPEIIKNTNTSSKTKNMDNKGLLSGIFGKKKN